MKTNSTVNNLRYEGRIKESGIFNLKKPHFPLGKSGWRIVKMPPTLVKVKSIPNQPIPKKKIGLAKASPI